MKRTRVFGGLLAASAALVGAVLVCLPASARQSGLLPVGSPRAPAPQDLRPVAVTPNEQPSISTNPGPIQQTLLPPSWNGGAVPTPSPMSAEQGAMNCTCERATPVPAGATAGVTENKPANPKDATVEELIARLAELKTKEAELTEILRAKYSMQQNGLKKLKKLGISIDDETPVSGCPTPACVPASPTYSRS